MTSLEMAGAAAKALDDKKALDIRILKVRDITVLADYFVICTGTSSTHVRALADEAEYQLGNAGIQPSHREGGNSKNWVVLDYGTVIIHVFDAAARSYYDLDHLWADAEPVQVSY